MIFRTNKRIYSSFFFFFFPPVRGRRVWSFFFFFFLVVWWRRRSLFLKLETRLEEEEKSKASRSVEHCSRVETVEDKGYDFSL
jgi:hypothetical protein